MKKSDLTVDIAQIIFQTKEKRKEKKDTIKKYISDQKFMNSIS